MTEAIALGDLCALGDGAMVSFACANHSYFAWKFAEETTYTRIGGWWDRKGENEIDLVCEDELARRLDFYEVKRDPSRLDLRALQAKTEAFFAKNPERRALEGECRGLSLADM